MTTTLVEETTIPLELKDITKGFPGVKALDGVSIRLDAGSIHALLGENGAGKSTLIKVITGVHKPDSGVVLLNGKPVHFASPSEAIAGGIGVVHQERSLITRFSIGENILLDRIAAGTFKPIDFDAIHAEASKWLRLLDLDVDPHDPVSRLSVAKMQLVEIARALSLQSRVLLMDEPTASLTPHETVALFALLKRLRDQGVTIVFVSHKLEEVLEICDHVTVLRDGRNACESRSMTGLGRADLVRLMIGRTEQIADLGPRPETAGVPVLELKGVSTAAGHRNIDLVLRKGEVLGLYGLVGAGRSELAKAIIGLDRITGGELRVAGKPAAIRTVREALERYGIGYVSEDRKQEGLILMHSVLENAGITVWSRLRGWAGFLRDRTIGAKVLPVIRGLEVKTPTVRQPVGTLSGGNQQKVSLAKWLAAGVAILIIDEPTVGIDVKTKAYFHELIHRLARQGTSVLVISSDMPEIITLADRIVVIDAFQVAGEVENDRNYDRVSHAIMEHIHGEDDVAA
jgi:ribose transport system ATP-binding protein